MGRALGVRLGLIAFSIECLAGLLEGKGFEDTVPPAFLAGGIAWGLGWFLGELARHVIEEHVKAKFALAREDPAKKAPSKTKK